MASFTLDDSPVYVQPNPRPRRRGSRSALFHPQGVRKSSVASSSMSENGGCASPVGRMRRMTSVLGSSPDVSPTSHTARGDMFTMNLLGAAAASAGSGGSSAGNGNGNGNGSGNGNGNGSDGGNGNGNSGNGSNGNGNGSNERSQSLASDRDRDVSMGVPSGSNDGSNALAGVSRKRQSVEGVEYPRRRATIAVSRPAPPRPASPPLPPPRRRR